MVIGMTQHTTQQYVATFLKKQYFYQKLLLKFLEASEYINKLAYWWKINQYD